MSHALTMDQVGQIVNNTMLVLLARPDLMPDWRANLQDLMVQSRVQQMEDEMLFVAAVLTLLHSPDDKLPTGTAYDYAWESLLISLATGVAQPLDREEEGISLERLLRSVAEAVVAVVTHAPEQKDTIQTEILQMRAAAENAAVPELIAWVDDALALLGGAALDDLDQQHQGIYATYWDAITQAIQSQ
ncbi:MAG: hypothetical protein K8S97_11805 [Anaerolineae bacterium]|nr:hypothetical protein [Anaerolineae bacterium]